MVSSTEKKFLKILQKTFEAQRMNIKWTFNGSVSKYAIDKRTFRLLGVPLAQPLKKHKISTIRSA